MHFFPVFHHQGKPTGYTVDLVRAVETGQAAMLECMFYSEDRARELGIRRFILKPLKKGDLAIAIRAVLDQG